MKQNDSKNARMTNQQAQEQRECDVLAYHQSENLQSDTRVCVKFGTSGLQWVKAGDELKDAIKWLNEDNDKDCLVSISEFRGERLNESYVDLIKIFYVKLYTTKKFRPSTKEEGRKIILDYCEANAIPVPSVIVHDGNHYILKWILRDPFEGKYLEVWKQVQKYLAERFFKLLDSGYYFDDENSPKRKYIEAHTNATAMLRVPGFLNNRTVELNLFTYNEETCLIFSTGQRYGASEVAVRLYLSKWKIEQYRSAKEGCRGYSHKKKALPQVSVIKSYPKLTERRQNF